MKKNIKLVCSLGSLCQSAEILKRNKLKICSYPFDWVFSDCGVIIDCLKDDFSKFLNKSYYGEVEHKFNERQCSHSFYHEDFFFHKNPRNDDDYGYYIRCVERFKELLNRDEEKLFIIIVVPNDTRHPRKIYDVLKNDPDNFISKTKKEFEDFNIFFEKYTKNYTLLVICNLVKDKNNYILSQQGNFNFLEFHTVSKSNGVKFIEEEDNIYLDNLINEIYDFSSLRSPHASA